MLSIANLIPDSVVPEGEMNPRDELLKVFTEAAIADVASTEACKIMLTNLGNQYNLSGMQEVTDLLTKSQAETIDQLKQMNVGD